MVKHYYFNETSDDHKYSSPVPVIGLYIAAATLVCFLFMLFDVVHGLRYRKSWLPCRFFSLNSLTLTLLAIATKLPVDLTTPMPSALDQLSKLSGTILICISMGFFMPSLKTKSDSECFLNMFSLSIFVVTAAVNVCIQMTTGVIFSYIVEHIIVLFCMMFLLMMLWTCTLGISLASDVFSNDIVKQLKESNPQSSSMIQKMKLVYESSYHCDPQFLLSGSPSSIIVGLFSALSALVLLEAVLHSLVHEELKFCCRISDYKWSMWVVVITQILTILLSSIVVGYRWFASVSHFDEQRFSIMIRSTYDIKVMYFHFSIAIKIHILSIFEFSQLGFVNIFLNIVLNTVPALQTGLDIVVQLVTFLIMSLIKYFSCSTKGEFNNARWIQEKGEKDIKRWMEKNKKSCPNQLIEILSSPLLSSQESSRNRLQLLLDEDKVSCILAVILVRMAEVLLPNNLCASLVRALDEAFEIIYFIDKKMNGKNFQNKMRRVMAKDMWMNRNNTNHWFHKQMVKKCSSTVEDGGSISELDRALGIIRGISHFYELKPDSKIHEEIVLIENEMNIIVEFVNQKASQLPMNASIDHLYGHIKQLFVDMLHCFLSQLPLAIFKHVVESPIEQYQERAVLGIKFLCKLEPLATKVDWSFPEGTHITNLITTQVINANTHHIEPVEAASVSVRVTGDGEIQEHV